jgi:hypothetical protein
MSDLNKNTKPITDFMTKFPKPDLAFMEALAAGDICFSDEQVSQSTLLFEELKRSKKVMVKAEAEGGARARGLFRRSRPWIC